MTDDMKAPVSMTFGQWGYITQALEMQAKLDEKNGNDKVAESIRFLAHEIKSQIIPQMGLSSSVEEIRRAIHSANE